MTQPPEKCPFRALLVIDNQCAIALRAVVAMHTEAHDSGFRAELTETADAIRKLHKAASVKFDALMKEQQA